MTRRHCGFAAALVLTLSSAALAQQGAQGPLVVGAPDPAAGTYLKEGTDVALATLSELNSNNNKVGDRVDMEVEENVTLNGRVVIPAGTGAVGEITVLRRKGMWGKSGKLEFRPLYLKMGDRRIRVRANTNREKGHAGTAGVVASIAFLPLAGFLVTGTSAVIPAHTRVNASLEEDVPVVFAGPPAGPMVVPPAAVSPPTVRPASPPSPPPPSPPKSR